MVPSTNSSAGRHNASKHSLFIQTDVATCGREEDMKKLKDFDLQWEFGPCIGT